MDEKAIQSICMGGILKINMAEKANTKYLIQFKWNSEMVKNLINTLKNSKAVCEYQGFDFNADKVRHCEEIRKNFERKYKEYFFSRIESLSEKPHEGFSAVEEKIEFCKKSQKERQGIMKG